MIATIPWSWFGVFHFAPDIPKNEPAPAPIADTTAADEAAARARAEQRRKKGRASTILTSPAGAKLGESGQGGNKTLGQSG